MAKVIRSFDWRLVLVRLDEVRVRCLLKREVDFSHFFKPTVDQLSRVTVEEYKIMAVTVWALKCTLIGNPVESVCLKELGNYLGWGVFRRRVGSQLKRNRFAEGLVDSVPDRYVPLVRRYATVFATWSLVGRKIDDDELSHCLKLGDRDK